MSTETEILTPLLNREFKLPEDGVFQFAKIGEYPIVDPVTKNRVVQVVDAESVKAMAADIAARKARPSWPGLLVDRDHFSYDSAKESRAAGWANDAQERTDGLYGPIRFSNSGKTDVEGGEYRFLSPVFDRKSAVPLGGNRYRVTRLLGLALTNTPNIRDIAALTNRAEELHGREATSGNPNKGNQMPKERLIAILSLAATATDDQLVEAVQALKNRASQFDTTKASLDTLTADHTALKNRHNTLLTESVTRVLDENKDLIPEEQKEAWKNRLTADFEGTSTLLKGLKRPAAAAPKKPLHQPGKGAAAAAAKPEGEEGDAFLNRVKELRAADSALTESAAIVRAASENPALYDAYRNRLAGGEQE